MKAVWNGATLAESDATIVVEGNHYFPASTINREYFRESQSHTICPWKGQASYFDIEVDGKINHDAVWYYSKPLPAANKITGYVAFWHGVRVER
ncbi:MAG TPA: DUF427 domain-containing protein [Ktedonobacterales bacterium]